MAVTVSNIQLGAGEVWTGGTAPAAGSDPNDPTAGTPSVLNAMTTNFAAPVSGGTYVGATQAPATVTYRPTYYMVSIEQAMAEVVAVPTAEEASLAATLVEMSAPNIANAWGQATSRTVVSPASQGLYVGSKSVLATKVVVLMARKRSGTGYYITTLYQAYSAEGATVDFNRRTESRLQMNLRALADVARPSGDQLFQLVAYDANPA